MICLKNRTFAVSQTTFFNSYEYMEELWFAWKIVLLQYRKQPGWGSPWHWVCCDLLEKSYFCSIANNVHRRLYYFYLVVICLKNRTFAVSQTTIHHKVQSCRQLWFAWKIVLLQYRKQLAALHKHRHCVVICLKNRTFAVSQTTMLRMGVSSIPLWFAWKIVLLQYRKQPLADKRRGRASCDLLEKSYFCSIANNRRSTFTSDFTLWFAWKIVLLQYRKQLRRDKADNRAGCDLLEKSYFCSIANNPRSWNEC